MDTLKKLRKCNRKLCSVGTEDVLLTKVTRNALVEEH